MSLNGIDTASYQTGLNPAVVQMDFNIVKATEGTGYRNPDFRRMADATLKADHLLGTYHYAAGGNPKAEAEFFVENIRDYLGKAILCLDWEGMGNSQFGKNDVEWCKTFLDKVKALTGVTGFIYMSKSVCRAHDWTPVANEYPLWCAQYASDKATGYQTSPWTDDKGFGAWAAPLIYQYTSRGTLSGWGNRLDLNTSILTKLDWCAYVKGSGRVEPVPFSDKSDNDLAVEVLFRLHGDDDVRRKKLGTRYDGTQQEVNRLCGNTALTVTSIQQYLKKYGCDDLV